MVKKNKIHMTGGQVDWRSNGWTLCGFLTSYVKVTNVPRIVTCKSCRKKIAKASPVKGTGE